MTEPKDPPGEREAPASPSRPAALLPAPGEIPAAPPEERPKKDFPVVGIGASAGGLAAFEAFFSGMPPDQPTGMAFVLVQHLSPDHKSILVELVGRYTRMRVYEVEDGMEVEPDCIYIIPPNRDMGLLNGTLQLLEPAVSRGLRLPVDFFFRSLARDQRERAICIVLSGTGSDGTLGVRAVKGEGGMAMAQQPDSTSYDGMPRSAIGTGLVDYVLPPAEMPAQLLAYVTHAFGKLPRRASSAPASGTESVLKKLCVLLRAQTRHDFSQYKETSLVRRMERRMAIHQIDEPEDYLRLARGNPSEVEALYRDLLIGVTGFFRDPDAFSALQVEGIPRLFAGKAPGAPVRVWVCGCSTGEEAYSIAILIQERMEALKQMFKVQIFATDVDRQAIEQARGGVYPASIAADISPERLKRFCLHDPESGVYRVQKTIRDMLVFSEQNVIEDPPFSNLDLVSCRNLLIYLNGELQKKLVPLFHYALNPGGVLFLGTAETVGELTTLFDALDRKWKLYVSKEDLAGATRPAVGDFAPSLREGGYRLPSHGEKEQRGREKIDLRRLTEQSLLAHYARAGVLVNGRGEILHIFGRTGRYLEPAPGDPAMNVLAMAREGLRQELSIALHKAAALKGPESFSGLRVKANGETALVNLTVRPVTSGPDGALVPDVFLVVLEEASPAEGPPSPEKLGGPEEGTAEADRRVADLQRELRAKEEYLQTTLEEMETSNEELKSTNEELQSVNEELQSTNEELETSKEELQSVNEELGMVNAELQSKVTDLSRVNNDMNNLLAGTGVGTVFVDLRLRISRFTPDAAKVINLIGTDAGRPIGHLVDNLENYHRLVEDVKEVLDRLAPREVEVRTKDGAWYLMNIRPYRTLENVIEGAVITFVEITELVRAREALRESEEVRKLANKAARVGVWKWDLAAGTVWRDENWEVLFGPVASAEEDSEPWYHEGIHPEDRDKVVEGLRAACDGSAASWSGNYRFRAASGRWLHVADRAIIQRDETGKAVRVVGAMVDVTGKKRLEELNRLVVVLRDSNDAVTVQGLDGSILAWNRGAESMYGWSEKEALSVNVRRMTPEDEREKMDDLFRRLGAGEVVDSFRTRRKTKGGRIVEVWLTATGLVDEAGTIVSVATTERLVTEEAL